MNIVSHKDWVGVGENRATNRKDASEWGADWFIGLDDYKVQMIDYIRILNPLDPMCKSSSKDKATQKKGAISSCVFKFPLCLKKTFLFP